MISVVICTYNRAASLKVTLEDIAQLIPPENHSVEILVVDNNSSDNTEQLLQSEGLCGAFPVRYIKETKQGLSYARNRGIEEAAGEWIVFTDDDVRIEPDWLKSLIRGCTENNVLAAGGAVYPIWPLRVPKWIAKDGPFLQHGVFLHYEPYSNSKILDMADPEPFGCNMAFRSEVFAKYGLFRTDLGRTGKRLLAGEDTEMYARLKSHGVPVLFVKNARVNHPVETQRLSLKYFFRWKYWAGYSAAMLEQPVSNPGIPRYLYRKFIQNIIHSLSFGFRGSVQGLIHYLGISISVLGVMKAKKECPIFAPAAAPLAIPADQ